MSTAFTRGKDVDFLLNFHMCLALNQYKVIINQGPVVQKCR